MTRTRTRKRPKLDLTTFHGVITTSPQMKALFESIRRAARSEATVLVRGASGTGKELVAAAIHAAGPRAGKPFRAVNCATFTAELLASELFGHVRGAFTGAVRDKAGLFAQADGGTLFLDELAELPLDLQARLLRVLQERRFVPVGGTDEVQVDVRLISATHASLRGLVEEHRFREDLMYRVRVVVLYLPALVERTGDVEALTWHFIDGFNRQGLRHIRRIDEAAYAAMLGYSWPGNVRELRNALEQAFVLGEGDTLVLDDLPPELQHPDLPPPGVEREDGGLRGLERVALVEAWKASGGKRQEMAEALGISRSTLYRRLLEHGLV